MAVTSTTPTTFAPAFNTTTALQGTAVEGFSDLGLALDSYEGASDIAGSDEFIAQALGGNFVSGARLDPAGDLVAQARKFARGLPQAGLFLARAGLLAAEGATGAGIGAGAGVALAVARSATLAGGGLFAAGIDITNIKFIDELIKWPNALPLLAVEICRLRLSQEMFLKLLQTVNSCLPDDVAKKLFNSIGNILNVADGQLLEDVFETVAEIGEMKGAQKISGAMTELSVLADLIHEAKITNFRSEIGNIEFDGWNTARNRNGENGGHVVWGRINQGIEADLYDAKNKKVYEVKLRRGGIVGRGAIPYLKRLIQNDGNITYTDVSDEYGSRSEYSYASEAVKFVNQALKLGAAVKSGMIGGVEYHIVLGHNGIPIDPEVIDFLKKTIPGVKIILYRETGSYGYDKTDLTATSKPPKEPEVDQSGFSKLPSLDDIGLEFEESALKEFNTPLGPKDIAKMPVVPPEIMDQVDTVINRLLDRLKAVESVFSNPVTGSNGIPVKIAELEAKIESERKAPGNGKEFSNYLFGLGLVVDKLKMFERFAELANVFHKD